MAAVEIVRRERSYSAAGVVTSVWIPDHAAVTVVRSVRNADGSGYGCAAVDAVDVAGVGPVRMGLHAVAMFVWVLVIGLAAMALVPTIVGFRPVLVSSGSMSPSVDRGDVVVTAPSDGEGLAVGAVIDHVVDGDRRIHRVVQATSDGYRTKGDANPSVDSGLVCWRWCASCSGDRRAGNLVRSRTVAPTEPVGDGSCRSGEDGTTELGVR